MVSIGVSAQLPAGLQQLYAEADSSLSATDYSAYLDLSLRAVKMADASADCRWQAESYRRLGVAYDYLKNKEDAWKWLRASLQKTNECASADTIRMRTERYLGAMFFGKQQGDSAVYYLSASATTMMRNGFYAEAASAYGMMGEAYSTIVLNSSLAEKQYLESIRLARKSGQQNALGFALFRYGCHLARNNACEKGRPFIDSSYIIFKSINSTEGIRWALNGIAFAESRCGEGPEVYNYMSQIQQMTDSLFRVETAQQAAHYEALYEKEKQDQKILALEQRTKMQRIYIAGIIVAILLLAAIAWLLISRRTLRNKQQAEKLLYETQVNNFREVLEAENNERQRIATELHDTLGQILSAARMHVSMIDSTLPNVDTSSALLDQAAKEVRQISHNLMPASLKEIGLETTLRQMTRTMSPSGVPEIQLHLDKYKSASEKKEMFLYRMAQELLSNSIRHGKPKKIQLTLSAHEHEIFLELIDDGVGFDVQSAPKGIGLKNIQTRIDLLRGQFFIESTPGKGSKFRIIIPE